MNILTALEIRNSTAEFLIFTTLEKLRDTLLPEHMSGEVRVG